MMPPLESLQLGLTRRRVCSVLTLLVFAPTTIGLPAASGVGTCGTGCRCDEDVQAAGECCCRKAAARSGDNGKEGCCDTPPARSCCSGRAADSCRPGRQNTEGEGSRDPAVSACTCGAAPLAGLVLNGFPRLSADRVEVPRSDDWQLKPHGSSPILPDRCLAPETPPPKVPAA